MVDCVNLQFYNYRFADQILNSNLEIKKEIMDSLRSIEMSAFGISRPELNESVESKLSKKQWQTQVPAFGAKGRGETRLDFLKSRIGVEVQFGHASFIGIDLLKFQVASYAVLDVMDKSGREG
jgi:hypothetical protein